MSLPFHMRLILFIFNSQKYVLDVLEKSSNTKTFAMVSRICHAVSYQWIGSSVTMTKWDDTWLHQGLNHFLREECAKKVIKSNHAQTHSMNPVLIPPVRRKLL